MSAEKMPMPASTSQAQDQAQGWEAIKLNDGRAIPAIGFGTWKIGSGDTVITQVDQALGAGFDHVDTAQAYRNERETGEALHLSGLRRDELWVTTKYSGVDPSLGIGESLRESLNQLGLKYVDLYLIHHPRLAKGDIPGAWAEMEKLHADGLAKSIGVSNFEIADLEELLAGAKVKPVVNQIQLQPYVWARQKKLLEFQAQHGIVTEAYSALIPLTSMPDGPVDKPVNKIAKRLAIAPEQVLLAWVKAKGAVILTTTSKKDRLERYLAVSSIDLSEEDVAAIDRAGSKPYRRASWSSYAAVMFFSGYLVWQYCCAERRESAY